MGRVDSVEGEVSEVAFKEVGSAAEGAGAGAALVEAIGMRSVAGVDLEVGSDIKGEIEALEDTKMDIMVGRRRMLRLAPADVEVAEVVVGMGAEDLVEGMVVMVGTEDNVAAVIAGRVAIAVVGMTAIVVDMNVEAMSVREAVPGTDSQTPEDIPAMAEMTADTMTAGTLESGHTIVVMAGTVVVIATGGDTSHVNPKPSGKVRWG